VKREPLNGAAHSLRLIQKPPSANESLLPEEDARPSPEPGDGWKVLGLALLPLGLVSFGYVVFKVGQQLKWW
jgi:hypothetical protein